MVKKLTTAEFISKAREVHGGRYDYAQTNYSSNKDSVTIICTVHGSFVQGAGRHLQGSGCRSCGFESKNSKQSLSTEDFLARAKAVHGDRYDYNCTQYQSKRKKVKIICREHGEFLQPPLNHLAGYGCIQCHRAKANNHKLDTEQFIRRARLTHGDLYDYSSTNYIHSQRKLTVTCRVHGNFEVTAAAHVQGRGCKRCVQSNRRSPVRVDLEEFIRRANAKHGNRYGYDQVRFSDTRDIVAIECSEHGIFHQQARQHYEGNGCPQCGRQRKKLTSVYQAEFIQQAQAVHGSKYDYSATVFKSKRNASRVTIICMVHGPFTQNPMAHLRGRGCTVCAGNSAYTRETYIAAAREIHGNKYRYDSVVYRNGETHVTITCHDHGPFSMVPSIHLAGQGCRKCADDRRGRKASKSTEAFIEEAKSVHRDTYDYSKTVYINNNRKVEITCREHGAFYQIPRSHLRGIGCPSCASSKGESLIRAILTDRKIPFLEQAAFPDLILPETGGRLRFDFYLPEHRAAIEFDGLQHFEPVDFTGGKIPQSELLEIFAHTQRKDAFKHEYCDANRIRLLRIPYTEIEITDMLITQFLQAGTEASS
jgi:hypothetical protein